MLLMGRVMACSHRLTVQTTVVSGAVCPHLQCKFWLGGCEPSFGEWVGDGSPE